MGFGPLQTVQPVGPTIQTSSASQVAQTLRLEILDIVKIAPNIHYECHV
jgi:hypothetical protein